MEDYKSWRHVFKLDPAKSLRDEDLERLCESGTDAVIVGGTDDVTLDDTLYLLSRIRQHALDCALEVSNIEAVTPGFDYYFIPSVLNSQEAGWIVGKHHEAIKAFGHTLDWNELVMEGYCILNPEAKAAQLTSAKTALNAEDVEAYALMAENLFRLPVFYLEYSGTYGDPEIVKTAARALQKTQLFYGGGISNAKQAAEMAEHADTIIVGNAVYENFKEALKTVKAVKNR